MDTWRELKTTISEVTTMNTPFNITTPRKDSKFRRHMTEPSILPSIQTNRGSVGTDPMYWSRLLGKDKDTNQDSIHIARSMELTSKSLPAISDKHHACPYDLPSFPKRTLPLLPRKNHKLAPIKRGSSESLQNGSNDGLSLTGINFLENQSIVMSRRRGEGGKTLLQPIDKNKLEEFRKWNVSLQMDDRLVEIAPPNTAINHVINQNIQKIHKELSNSQLLNTEMNLETSDNRLANPATQHDHTADSGVDLPSRSYATGTCTLTCDGKKRIEDWLEDCIHAVPEHPDHQSDEEYIDAVGQTNETNSRDVATTFPPETIIR